MLEKKHRLTAPLRRTSIRTTGPFAIKIAQNATSVSRFGFVVSKRVSTKAVERNRMKRILRTQIQEELPHIVPGYDLLFIVNKPFHTSGVIARALRQILKEQQLWQNN